MKIKSAVLIIMCVFLTISCSSVKGVRVDTTYGIVDVKEDGKVSAQIEVDGVEFYIEDNELIEIDISGVVEPSGGIEVDGATVTLLPNN